MLVLCSYNSISVNFGYEICFVVNYLLSVTESFIVLNIYLGGTPAEEQFNHLKLQ